MIRIYSCYLGYMDYAIMQNRAIRPIKISRISKLSQNSTLERHNTISHCKVYI